MSAVAAVALLGTGAALVAAHAQHSAAPALSSEARFAANAQSITIPFELFRGNRIFLTATVNGRTAEVLLDSGAAATVVDRSFAAAAGISGGSPVRVRGGGGMTDGVMVPGISITAGPLTLANTTVLVLDMQPVAHAIGRHIDLVLGRDAFDAGVVDIDFEASTLRFVPREHFDPPSGSVRLPMTKNHGIRQIPISVGDKAPILADLDLGAGGALILARSEWQADAEISGLAYARGSAGGVGGLTSRRMVTLRSVTVGGHRFVRVPALLNENPEDLPSTGANIGIELLKRFRLSIDYGGGALYLKPNANALSRPIAKDRVGMRTELEGDHLKVVYVSPDGPAAKAGWREGDAIVAINDVRITPDFYRSQWANMSQLAPGTRLDLVRADGTHQPVVLTDYF